MLYYLKLHRQQFITNLPSFNFIIFLKILNINDFISFSFNDSLKTFLVQYAPLKSLQVSLEYFFRHLSFSPIFFWLVTYQQAFLIYC